MVVIFGGLPRRRRTSGAVWEFFFGELLEQEPITLRWREAFSGIFIVDSSLASNGMFFCFVFADSWMMFVGWEWAYPYFANGFIVDWFALVLISSWDTFVTMFYLLFGTHLISSTLIWALIVIWNEACTGSFCSHYLCSVLLLSSPVPGTHPWYALVLSSLPEKARNY